MRKHLIVLVLVMLCGFMLLTAVVQVDGVWGRRRPTPTPHHPIRYYPCVYSFNGQTLPYPHC